MSQARRGPRPDPTQRAGCTERAARTWGPPGAKRWPRSGNNRTSAAETVRGLVADGRGHARRCRRFRSDAASTTLDRPRATDGRPTGTSRTQSDSPDETAVLTARDMFACDHNGRAGSLFHRLQNLPRDADSTAAIATRPKAVSSAGAAVNGPDQVPGHCLARRPHDGPAPLDARFRRRHAPHAQQTGVHPSQRAGDPPTP